MTSFQHRLVVHVGMPKTGSSTIQEFMVQNEPEFRLQGISVLGFGGTANQEVLANELLNLDGRGGPATVFSQRGTVDDCLPRWREFRSQIISMESLWGPGPLAVRALRNHAATVGAQIEVIGFFRSLDTWLWSWWAQETKSAWIDWCAFLEVMIKGERGFLSRCFSSWATECPSAVLRVRPYEGPDLVGRFLESIAVDCDSLEREMPNQNVGVGRLEAVRRAAVVRGIWQDLHDRGILRSSEMDVGVAARLVLEATQREAIGFESTLLHKSFFPDILSDPTFNNDSFELIALFATEWANDAELFVERFVSHFDDKSYASIRELIVNARELAIKFQSNGKTCESMAFPRRDFADTLPTNSWELALARGVGSAIDGALHYIGQL